MKAGFREGDTACVQEGESPVRESAKRPVTR